jgi:lysophospholipase L1-like esterase
MWQRMRVVILGDSVTAGFGLGTGQAELAYPRLLAEKLQQARLAVDVVVSALDGIDTAYALRRFGRLVAQYRPHWVVMMLGLNDARPAGGKPAAGARTFGDNVEALVQRIEAIDSRAVLVSPNPRQSPAAGAEQAGGDLMQSYVGALGQVASDRRLPWIDLHRQFLAERNLEELIPDGVHPSVAGHRLIAEVLAEELIWLLAQEPSATGEPAAARHAESAHAGAGRAATGQPNGSPGANRR